MKSENNLELIFSLSWIEIGPQHLKLVKLELVSKALNRFVGDCVIFPRLGTGDTDRWQVNLCLCATCQCLWCPISEEQYDPPKVI